MNLWMKTAKFGPLRLTYRISINQTDNKWMIILDCSSR